MPYVEVKPQKLMEKFIFQAGRKTFDFVKESVNGSRWIRVLERRRGRIHEAEFSVEELIWICDIMEEASLSEVLFWRNRKYISREVLVEYRLNRFGKYLRISGSSKGRRRTLCMPEVVPRGGWSMVAAKIHRFLLESGDSKKTRFKSYREAAEIPPWPDLPVKFKQSDHRVEVDFEVDENSYRDRISFLQRCLVGRIGG